MSQQRLKTGHKRFIVQQLACFCTPNEIVAAVKARFEIVIARQLVERYDPTKTAGAQLRQPLRALFTQTRARYIAVEAAQAVAHRSYRLDRLNEMERVARKQGRFSLAASLLEQAAKEMGGAYTNRRPLIGKDGGPLRSTKVAELRDDELNRIAAGAVS